MVSVFTIACAIIAFSCPAGELALDAVQDVGGESNAVYLSVYNKRCIFLELLRNLLSNHSSHSDRSSFFQVACQ